MFFDTTDLRDDEIYLQLYRTVDEDKIKGYVPSYCFKILRCADDIEIGQCDLRVGHNSNTFYSGNIGYQVYEPFRGNHYAGKACKLLYRLAERHRMGKVIITCSPDNMASRRTCEYSGAEFVEIIDLPEWHDIYKSGRSKSCQYIVDLSSI